MKTDTSRKIIEFIAKNKFTTAKEIIAFFNYTPAAIHRHLSKLIKNGELKKVGKPPKVFYSINQHKSQKKELEINHKTKNIIEKTFLKITPSGEKKEGWDGFLYWCNKKNENPLKTAKEYINTLKKYEAHKTDGLISGMHKFKETFNSVYLDEVFYLDFYSIVRFGKTKLGQQLLYGKQSGNRKLINEIINTIKPKIDDIIEKYKIDGVGFVPWTIDRKVQFMRELNNGLKLNLRKINIDKIKNEIPVPQKSLSKKNDRIENARNTMIVNEKGRYKNILLIDDAVGSGATLNEIAKQIKENKIATKVIGLAITGSFKDFEVISEV